MPNQRPQTKEFGLCIKLLSLEHDFEIKIHMQVIYLWNSSLKRRKKEKNMGIPDARMDKHHFDNRCRSKLSLT